MSLFDRAKPRAERPALVQLGTYCAVDPDEVSGVYIKDNKMVVRIGGMGVIELSADQLHMSVPESVRHLITAVNDNRGVK